MAEDTKPIELNEVTITGVARQQMLPLGRPKPRLMEFPLYIGGKALISGIPRLLKLVADGMQGIDNLSQMLVYMKGERNQAGSAGGTNNPFKKLKPDPKKPGNVLERNSRTGKTVSKPAPPGFWEWWNSK